MLLMTAPSHTDTQTHRHTSTHQHTHTDTQTHTHTHTHSLSLPSNVDCTHKQEDAFLRDVEKVAAASGFCTMLSVYTFRLDVSDLADVGVHGQEQEKQTSRKTSRSRVVKPAMPKDVAPEDTALGE